MELLVATLLVCGSSNSFAQGVEHAQLTDLSQTPSGSKLNYFGRVDEGVYKGSKPKNDADFWYLQSLHVKYLVNLRVLPWLYRADKRKAKKYGIKVITVPMNASPMSPSEKHVARALGLLHDPRCQPGYFVVSFGAIEQQSLPRCIKWVTSGCPRTPPNDICTKRDTRTDGCAVV